MTHFVRLALFVALVTAVACKDSTEPARPPTRAELNGIWRCYRANLFSVNPQNNIARWRLGSCGEYIAVTNPSRADSIDTTTFVINEMDEVTRAIEFRPGEIAYDSAGALASVTYPDRPAVVYDVTPGFLTHRLDGLDLTGDGVPDSLQLTFCKHLLSCPVQ
jgi:hypothetical protein